MTIELARAAELAGRVVGVDFDQVKLDLARREAAQQGVSNITFDTRDVSDWEPDESFDVIYARFLLTHLADPRKVISTMHKHLRPGGCARC